jgi:DNA adenine methylase
VSTFEKQFNALENINEKSKKEVEKDLSQIIDRTMSRIQKVAFNEVLSAYREGKESIKDLAKMAPPTATSGGKARMARRLDSIIPEHNIYGESFLGMGSVFLKKEGAQESYLNDADPEVMKIWESLQKGDEKVFSFLAKQEWNGDKSHFEKLKAQDPGQLDDLSRTYRKIYLRRYSNQAKEQGFRSDGKNLGAPQWLKSIDRLQKYTEKLKGVHLSTGDWKDISRKIDGPSTFHFIDPPYTDEFAKELTEFLPSLKGKWLVTFSENKILKDFFKEKVHEIKVKANANFWNVPKDSYRTEYLISNYPMNVPKGSIFKATAPTEIHFTDLPFNRADIKVLEAIYKENPFWTAFSGMNQSISDKLKDIVRDSYLPPDSKKFKTALEEIKEKYPHRNPAIQEELAYMRTGKLSLAQVIREMKKVLKTEVYRLERIARSETAAVTAKGREIEFRKRDDGTNRYDWPGPQDKFTSEECTEIKARVQKEGKGLGVSLDRMLEIHKEVNKKFNAMRKSQWNYRDWLPHANCRHVLRRVV